MATTIKLKNSVTTTNAPSSLAQGEVAINITDKKVWVGNAATTPIQLLGDGGSVNFTTVDTTNLQVTNIKAKDGTASASIANSTGAFTVAAAFAANGGATLGDASGDALTINSSAVSIPNGLNFDSNTFVIDAANNNVGIGTSSPVTRLQVNYTTTAPSLSSSTGAGLSIVGSSTLKLNFGSYGTSNFGAWIQATADNSSIYPISLNPLGGPVGIGVQNPVSTFDVRGTSTIISNFYGNNANNWISVSDDNGTSQVNFGSISGGNWYLFANASKYGAFFTGGSERMRIDSSGNVLIGTTTNGFAGRNFVVQQTGVSSVAILTGDYSSGATSMVTTIEALGGRNDGNGTFGGRHGAAFRRSDGTAIGSGANIGVYAFGGQWGTDTSYQSSKVLYPASIVGVAEGSFTASNAMPTAIVFRTGSTGESINSVNTSYGTERMRIDSSGNVGIGTSSPTTKLTVVSGTNGGIALNDGTVNTILYNTSSANGSVGTTTNHAFAFYTNNTERMRITSSGYVGINTTTANSPLTVAAPSGNAIAFDIIGRSADNYGIIRFVNNAYNTTLAQLLYNGTDLALGNNTNNPITFATNNTERMRITSGGDLLVGTTTSPVQQTTTAGSIVATGSINSLSGNVGNTTTGTSYDLFTAVQGASYIVNINAANTCSVYLVTCESSSSTVTCTSLLVQNNANVTNSGTTIRFTNNYGGALNDVGWSAIRLI